MTNTTERKPLCFVIQAFDGGKYDRRYNETIRPALIKANVEPQRADEILGLNPIVEKIERAIEAAAICVAEVSEDNPNVWLELGYALALNRPTVIVCDRAVRPRLPFDIQHRPVIMYRTDSRSGYEELERDLGKFVMNQLSTEQRIAQTLSLKPGSEATTDLEKYEVSILTTTFAFWPTPIGSISHWELEQKLRTIGFNDIALALGLTGLVRRGLILERAVEEETREGIADVKHYQITPNGIGWIESHKAVLELRIPESKRKSTGFDEMSDDIPF
jgi:nucleoside 2-deoxyribosyltransferase